MSISSVRPLLSPEEIAVRSGPQVPHLHFPRRAEVYAEREMRLRQLAALHPMRDFLLFTAELARAQHEVLQAYPAVPLPDAASLGAAARAGMPPLPAAHWPRDSSWRLALRQILDQLLPRLAGNPAQQAVRALRASDDETLEAQADRLLQGMMLGLDLGAAPLIAAGLQAYWTHLLLATQEVHGGDRLAPFGLVGDATSCPCCGSRPTASVLRIDPGSGTHRYLHCSLCSAQWHMVRIKCSHCESTKGIHYQSLQPLATDASASGKASVEAEACDECRHYLKIVRMERDSQVEPVADDLASITLDLLVSDAGFTRHGVNLMLLFGDPEGSAAIDDVGGG